MATIGEELEKEKVSIISTSVTDSTPTYVAGQVYDIDTRVQEDDKIYQIPEVIFKDFNFAKGHKRDDVVLFDDKYYTVQEDIEQDILADDYFIENWDWKKAHLQYSVVKHGSKYFRLLKALSHILTDRYQYDEFACPTLANLKTVSHFSVVAGYGFNVLILCSSPNDTHMIKWGLDEGPPDTYMMGALYMQDLDILDSEGNPYIAEAYDDKGCTPTNGFGDPFDNEFAVALFIGGATDTLVWLNDATLPPEDNTKGWFEEILSPADDSRFTLSTLVEIGAYFVSVINQYRPFDGTNITPAVHDGTVSDMDYVIEGKGNFNAFTLAKILASSIDYIFKYPVGHYQYALWLNGVVVASGGNGIVKTGTVTIDCARDCDNILSKYPTTVIFYADTQMLIDVENVNEDEKYPIIDISLSYDGEINLGDYTINNTVTGGFTNMDFTHTVEDFNNYTPDAFGNIPQATKAKLTEFKITVDILLQNYDHCVSFNESIAGKFVTIDASDSGGSPSDSLTIFGSLIRRVMITGVSSKPITKEGELYKMAGVSLTATEVV